MPVKSYLQLLLEEVHCFALVLLYSYSDVQKSSLCHEIQLKDHLVEGKQHHLTSSNIVKSTVVYHDPQHHPTS